MPCPWLMGLGGLVLSLVARASGIHGAAEATRTLATSSYQNSCGIEESSAIYLYPYGKQVVGGLVSEIQCPIRPFCDSKALVFAQTTNESWPLPQFKETMPVYTVAFASHPSKVGALPLYYSFSQYAHPGWTGIYYSHKSTFEFINTRNLPITFWTGFDAKLRNLTLRFWAPWARPARQRLQHISTPRLQTQRA